MSKLYLQKNLQLIFGVTLMMVLGVSSIIPVLPAVMREMGVSAGSIGLLITMFTLPGVVLTPFLGILADRWGRKKVLVPALMVFGIFGTACAFVHTWKVLLFFRFLQGSGAAALGVINVTLIGDLYSGRERTSAMGYNASVLSLGTAIYPAVGGGLAVLGWNYPFLLPIIAIFLGLVIIFKLENPEPKAKPTLGKYFADALLELRQRQMFGLLLATLITFILLYGPFITYLPVLMDNKFHVSAPKIGLLISLASISSAIVASQLGRLALFFSESAQVKTAFLLYALSCLLIPLLPSFRSLALPALLFGCAQALAIPNVMTLLTGLVSMQNRAALMAVNGTVLRLGQTLGPMLMGLLYTFGGTRIVFWSGTALALAMFFAGLIFIRFDKQTELET